MSTPNPLEGTGAVANGPVSRKQHVIAGLKTVVYGLEELPKGQRYVACLWLLHPRLSEQSKMAPIADTVISRWNKRLKARNALSPAVPGLIAVSLDQRNHGSREIDPVANEAWRGGNPRHAQDMFSIYRVLCLCGQHRESFVTDIEQREQRPTLHSLLAILALIYFRTKNTNWSNI